MHIRRLTPSPNLSESSDRYLLSLRPRDLQDQIVETLRLNDLPLVTLGIGQSLDFQIIQRLLNENSRIKMDLIGLSLASYRYKEINSLKGAETLLNYLLSKLNDKELLSLKELLKVETIDDTVLGNVINLIRLTGVGDPLKFVELLENSLNGTINLRSFMGTLTLSTEDSIRTLENISKKEVPSDILEAINEKESKGLLELNAKANEIETRRTTEATRIADAANFSRLAYNTGITFGVSGLIWASVRLGFWESLLGNIGGVTTPTNLENTSNNQPGLLQNISLGVAGLTGFLLKKGLRR